LVAVTEPGPSGAATFRAQNDATFTRYQRVAELGSAMWKAYATDGTVYTFGQQDHVGNCTRVSIGYAPLTQQSDGFGNVIDYTYTAGVDNECVISSISWGKNDSAGIAHFATATFDYGAKAVA
jgi:hypothetical protein